MSVNKYQPHIFVLPEDEANREIANGFLLHHSVNLRSIQVLPNAGGWSKVKDLFYTVHAPEMDRFTCRHMVLLVDFDRDGSRFNQILKIVPAHLMKRVAIIGVWSEPEDLRRVGFTNTEELGTRLADECRSQQRQTWEHELLRHNLSELERIDLVFREILFDQ